MAMMMNAPSSSKFVTTPQIAIQLIKQPEIETKLLRVADFWEEAGRCLYDDDEDDVWECIDEEFKDWLDDELSASDDYDDFIDELEDANTALVSRPTMTMIMTAIWTMSV